MKKTIKVEVTYDDETLEIESVVKDGEDVRPETTMRADYILEHVNLPSIHSDELPNFRQIQIVVETYEE